MKEVEEKSDNPSKRRRRETLTTITPSSTSQLSTTTHPPSITSSSINTQVEEVFEKKVAMPTKRIYLVGDKRRDIVRDVAIDIGGGNSVAIVKVECVNENGDRYFCDKLLRARTYISGNQEREIRWEQNASTIRDDILAQVLLSGLTMDDLASIGREVEHHAKKICTL